MRFPKRVPKRITFPFGYVVTIKEVSGREMKDLEDSDVRNLDGCWDAEERTIYLVKTLPPRRKRYLLAHELVHALIDFHHAMFNEGVMKP